MASITYSVDNVIQLIAQNLGVGRVSVELTREHLLRAMDAALKLLCRYRPEYGFQVVPLIVGGNRYPISARNMTGVVGCSFFHSGRRFEEAPYYTRWVDRMMELTDMKDTQRVFGDQPDWHVQDEYDPVTQTNSFYLYAQFTRSTFIDTFARLPSVACLQFTWAIEPSDDPEVGLRRLNLDMRQWFEAYATAHARMILGDIRGKFQGIPGASDGSVMPNDGAAQVQRALGDIARLEQDIQRRARQLPLMID